MKEMKWIGKKMIVVKAYEQKRKKRRRMEWVQGKWKIRDLSCIQVVEGGVGQRVHRWGGA